jgi:hypothetical protein
VIAGTRYQPMCPACRAFIPVVLFPASSCDFETLRGTGTDTLYRLDLTRVNYGVISRDDALTPARVRESAAGGELVRVEDDVWCHFCAETFKLDLDAQPPGEEIETYAILLPAV